MAAAWLKARHLGCSSVKVYGPRRKVPAQPPLVVRLQQHHVTALAGQQCCPGEAGNTGPQHHHIC